MSTRLLPALFEVALRKGVSAFMTLLDDLGALVRSVLVNLIGTAWKFTRDRAPAKIAIERVEAMPEVLRVRDNGAGFDVARAADLFAPFHWLHSSRELEGVGIGLAIVDRIVRRHGGRIWVEAAPDAGATFFSTLAP